MVVPPCVIGRLDAARDLGDQEHSAPIVAGVVGIRSVLCSGVVIVVVAILDVVAIACAATAFGTDSTAATTGVLGLLMLPLLGPYLQLS